MSAADVDVMRDQKGIDPDDYEIDGIELLKKPNYIDFDEVKLDWGMKNTNLSINIILTKFTSSPTTT